MEGDDRKGLAHAAQEHHEQPHTQHQVQDHEMRSHSVDVGSTPTNAMPLSLWRRAVRRLSAWSARLPAGFWQIVILLIVSRLVLTLVGMFARLYIPDQNPDMMQFSGLPFIDVWGRWDSTWYYKIALNGYTMPIEWAWYPGYPLLVRAAAFVVQDAFIAGLLVSNAALVVACVYLYKLACLDIDKEAAMRSVKYMVLWPTAFVFSAVLTESTFLALVLAAFYYARKEKWLVTGILGACFTLTKSIGLFMIVPLAFIYLRRLYVPPRGIDFTKLRADILSLLLMPLAWGCWMMFNFLRTGDPFRFLNVQNAIWGRTASGALRVLIQAFNGNFNEYVGACCAVVALAVLVVFVRRIPFAYWLYGMIALLLPLSAGTALSMQRYTVVVFPFFIILALMTRSRKVDVALSVLLAGVQLVCMMYWGIWLFA